MSERESQRGMAQWTTAERMADRQRDCWEGRRTGGTQRGGCRGAGGLGEGERGSARETEREGLNLRR